jgi:hypothetical protein
MGFDQNLTALATWMEFDRKVFDGAGMLGKLQILWLLEN